MIPTSALMREKFDSGLRFEEFVATGEPLGHIGKWRERYVRMTLNEPQAALVSSFVREMRILTLTGTWCGDCALQGSALARIAESSPLLHLRFLPRDPHADLMVKMKINAGFRVPVTFFCSEDFEPVSVFGDRTLSSYRTRAMKQLGEACPPLGGEPPANPIQVVLQEVLDEVERVHLLLRTSGRLRELHGD